MSAPFMSLRNTFKHLVCIFIRHKRFSVYKLTVLVHVQPFLCNYEDFDSTVTFAHVESRLKNLYEVQFLPIKQSQLEPCADVIVSAAAHRSIFVGGVPLVRKNQRGVGGRTLFQKVPEKISFYLS